MSKRVSAILAGLVFVGLLAWPLIGSTTTLVATKLMTADPTVGSGTASGTYTDMLADDGSYYSLNEGNGAQMSLQFSSWQPFTEAGETSVSKMDISLNGKVNSVNDDTFYVYFWNYSNSTWVQVGNFGQLATGDVTATVSVTNTTQIANFLSGGNFRVQILDTKAAGGSESVKNNILYIDQLKVDFTYDDGVNDTTAPQVIGKSPAAGSTNQATTTTIKATFDEAIQSSTINSSTFTVSDGAGTVVGSINYDSTNKEAVFTPGVALAYNTTYTVTLTTGIKDLADNSLASNVSWSFTTTAEGVDVTAPTVTGVTPANGETAVSPSTSVEAVFSEALDPASVTGSTVYLKQGSTTVTTTLTYDQASKTIILVPSNSLSYSTTYTATITSGVKDLAGNPLSANYSWSFTTSAAPSSAPAAPDKVLAMGIASTEIAINWVPVDQAEGYKVYRSSTSGGTYTYIGSVVGQLEAYYVDSGRPASTSYYYKVSAYNSIGESAQSTSVTHTYTDESGQTVNEVLNKGTTYPPLSPRGIVLTPGPNQVTISWNANPESNIQGYNVYRAERSGTSKTNGLVKLNTNLITVTTSFTDLTTANYYDYYYRVGAVDSAGKEGYLSAERFIRIEGTPPSYVPHKDFTADSAPCATCHTTHAALGPNLINADTEPELCFSCHDGTGSQNITYQNLVIVTMFLGIRCRPDRIRVRCLAPIAIMLT